MDLCLKNNFQSIVVSLLLKMDALLFVISPDVNPYPWTRSCNFIISNIPYKTDFPVLRTILTTSNESILTVNGAANPASAWANEIPTSAYS